MADVGVRELKARLSEYLDRAARGEIIRVTERGRPKAILAPVPGTTRLEEGMAAGWVRPAKGRSDGPWHRARARQRVAELLRDDRGD
jgi:prevent-host-death family protein